MESKNDVVKLEQNNKDLVIKINDESVITLNKFNNKLDVKLIFNKLNIKERYKFDLNLCDVPSEKDLGTLYKYTKEFLESLQKTIDQIDYASIDECE